MAMNGMILKTPGGPPGPSMFINKPKPSLMDSIKISLKPKPSNDLLGIE